MLYEVITPLYLQFLYVRTDWLKEMNLPEPKTMDDLMKISEAFSKRTENGKSYGLAVSKDPFSYNFV